MAADPPETTTLTPADGPSADVPPTSETDVSAADSGAEAAGASDSQPAGHQPIVGKRSARELIEAFEAEQLKADLPEIFVGDTVRVGVRIREGNKERIQPYEGVVIAMRHGGLNATITVRRIFQGIGVERVFLLHSPQVASVKVERRGKVRRAKLFYLRDRVGKATRVKQRFDR